MKRVAASLLLVGVLRLAAPLDGRVGDPAPALQLRHWINSPPLETTDLRGKVVLIRWLTDRCSYCSTSAPALRQLQQKYGSRGFQVIGIFHPKPPGDWNIERARRAAERLRLNFPIAVDADWQALQRWWLDTGRRDWTSVSFLLDKQGTIRYIHPGGEFHQGAGDSHASCRREYKEIDEMIERLLTE